MWNFAKNLCRGKRCVAAVSTFPQLNNSSIQFTHKHTPFRHVLLLTYVRLSAVIKPGKSNQRRKKRKSNINWKVFVSYVNVTICYVYNRVKLKKLQSSYMLYIYWFQSKVLCPFVSLIHSLTSHTDIYTLSLSLSLSNSRCVYINMTVYSSFVKLSCFCNSTCWLYTHTHTHIFSSSCSRFRSVCACVCFCFWQ